MTVGSSCQYTQSLPEVYAIGDKFWQPVRPVIATGRDVAIQMNGINELITSGK